uniref:Thaumatin-like protein n=1 Tax=Araucaria cunninghamii TaxID=56994 RepID=A0A0D6QTW2_ARACU
MYTQMLLGFLCSLFIQGAFSSSFTVMNNCEYNVWPGFLSNAGIAPLSTTGFELVPGAKQVVTTPTRWSGRLWGRTGCAFDAQGKGNCTTGDCGNQLECDGAGAVPPATLAEFTVGLGTMDFYDVSLVDGYNIPMLVVADGGSGACTATGCIADINRSCPKELQVDDGGSNVMACKSACGAFGSDEYCCSGAYANPNTCKPSAYSQIFKSACPRAYSYAFDDKTSTFTCTGADYTVTFCPTVAMASQKHSTAATSPTSSNGTDARGDANPLYTVSAVIESSSSSGHQWAGRWMGVPFLIILMLANFTH